MFKKIFSFVIISILIFQPFISWAGIDSQTIDYLKSKAPNPWITMALVAAGESSIENNHLKTISGEEAINFCAPILAITALGENPATFGDQDLIAKLKSFYNAEQIGSENLLNDDIFGILALISAGVANDDVIIEASKNFIINHQNEDGGWGFSVTSDSDTNMTAVAIMALLEINYTASSGPITKAINYLQATQNEDGGFPYNPAWDSRSDAASDSWVISALNKLGIDPDTWVKNEQTPIKHLQSLKAGQGYFKYQPGLDEDSFTPVTTSYAVIALTGKFYPINKISVETQEFDFRIEGDNTVICSGKTAGPTALDIVKNASQKCSFTYIIKDTIYGPYLKKINDEEAEGLSGWLYLVNQEAPMVGANDYQLKEGDQTIWYFGEWGWLPARLSLDKTSAALDEPVKATVEFYNNDVWQPLSEAVIKAGANEFLTDDLGEANFTLPAGIYNFVAEKDGYIRSEQVRLKVGEPTSQQTSLVVEIDVSGQPGGIDSPDSVISFVINPDELNFGKLKPGEQASQQISVLNNGNVSIDLQAEVNGDDIFKDNLDLDDKNWQFFESQLNESYEKQIKATLKVPNNYNEGGQKQGVLIFWATQAE